MELHGEKLRGAFVLVRTGHARGKEQWLVLHKRDDDAVAGWDPEDHPRSVLSGRTNDEVAADPDRGGRAPAAPRELRAPGPRSSRRPRTSSPSSTSCRRRARGLLQGRELALTNLDKVLFPAGDDGDPVTKRELVRYYACDRAGRCSPTSSTVR